MRLTSFLDQKGRSRLGLRDGAGTLRDVTDVAISDGSGEFSPLRHYLSRSHDLRALSEALPTAPTADAVELLPVVPDPSKIVAAPVNYRDHQQEMNEAIAVDSLGVFLKSPSSALAHGGTVRLPYVDRRFDQEGELAVVIGRPASHVAVAAALDYVAGYTCLLDMTMRGGEDRSLRKSFDTFTPLGPELVTPDEVGPIEALKLRTWVGGELRQNADLVDLIWDVPRLIAYISSVMLLQPGDVIATGTPAGVGQVGDGQDVRVEISGIGRLEVSVSDAGAVACPTLGAGRGPVPPAAVTPPREKQRISQ